MKIIVCLDDNLGMAFNNRRQSKDRILREKIAALCNGSKLYMNQYSFSQFEGEYDNIVVDENFFKKAQENDFCFAEVSSVPIEKVNKIYAFFWNRNYPADLYLGFDFEKNGFSLEESTDFKGFSHEKITLNIYTK